MGFSACSAAFGSAELLGAEVLGDEVLPLADEPLGDEVLGVEVLPLEDELLGEELLGDSDFELLLDAPPAADALPLTPSAAIVS